MWIYLVRAEVAQNKFLPVQAKELSWTLCMFYRKSWIKLTFV